MDISFHPPPLRVDTMVSRREGFSPMYCKTQSKNELNKGTEKKPEKYSSHIRIERMEVLSPRTDEKSSLFLRVEWKRMKDLLIPCSVRMRQKVLKCYQNENSLSSILFSSRHKTTILSHHFAMIFTLFGWHLTEFGELLHDDEKSGNEWMKWDNEKQKDSEEKRKRGESGIQGIIFMKSWFCEPRGRQGMERGIRSQPSQ